MENHRILIKALAVAGLCGWGLGAATVDVSKLPPAAKKEINFRQDIEPILKVACLECHSGNRPKGRYSMENRENTIKGGSSKEAAVVVENSAKSPLIHMVAHLIEEMEMPPLDNDKYKKLTPEEIGLLRAWIDQGLKWGD
jgi:hypothetical protein